MARGLSQQELATLAEVGKRTIQRYESGGVTQRVHLEVLSRIAAVFGRPVQEVFPELFGRRGPRNGGRPIQAEEGGADADA